MSDSIPLTKQQKKIINVFYNSKKEKVLLNKKYRNDLYNLAKNRKNINNFEFYRVNCPSLAHQIERSYREKNNIQCAVFSECIYAQTLANIFNLVDFYNCYVESSCIPDKIKKLINSYGLTPRYMYCNKNKSKILIQAGGCNSVDSALIIVDDLSIYTIEFKERGSKTGEHDLPKYEEDGKIKDMNLFLNKYPYFEMMLKDHNDLNFFVEEGHNIHNFSIESLKYAISNSYTNVKKYADVICSEDVDSYLIMFPANQIDIFADIYGEIRPAGRNSCKVWTPQSLKKILKSKNAEIRNGIVKIDKNQLKAKKARGGDENVNRYGINSLFFVYSEDCKILNDKIIFNINSIHQLIPTIASKMSMKNEIKYDDFKNMLDI